MATRAKELWKDRDNQINYLKWLMNCTKPYLGRLSIAVIISTCITAISLWMVSISKDIIDSATAGNPIKRLIIIYILLMLGMQVLSIISDVLYSFLMEHFSFGLRKQIYEKIVRAHWLEINRFHSGDLMTRLTSDAGNIADGIIGTIPHIFMLLLELMMVFIMLFVYSPLLAVLALLVAPVAGITCWWLGRKLNKLQKKVQESESEYRSFMQESISNLLIIKSFANEDYSVGRLTKLRAECFNWIYKKLKINLASSTVMSLAFQLGYIAAFAYGAYEISIGEITYGTMSVFLALVNRVQSPILGLSQQIPRIIMVLASAGRIMEIEKIPIEDGIETFDNPNKIGVSVNNLTFGYNSSEIVLKDIDFDIKPGEFVAIVGESGIGKTTLIRLMMSFMNSYEGSIEYTNEDGNSIKANSKAREFISYVPQGNTLFSGTIRDNIQMGNLIASEEEIAEALKMSAAYDFVMELPDGLDTLIGERGHGISEGQAQRIAIARALVRKAPFLILDEATSALDEATEQQVIEGLLKLSPRPTCVVITHRLSILKYCDRQLTIDAGQI